MCVGVVNAACVLPIIIVLIRGGEMITQLGTFCSQSNMKVVDPSVPRNCTNLVVGDGLDFPAMWDNKMTRMCLKIPDSEMNLSLSSSPMFILAPGEHPFRCFSWGSNVSDVIEATRNMRFEWNIAPTPTSVVAEFQPVDVSCINSNYIANLIAVDDHGDLTARETDRTLALWRLVEGDNAGEMKKLLDNSPDALHWEDWSGRTALHLAAELGNSCLNQLLESGADPDAVDHLGHLPLHIAADTGKDAATVALLEASRKGIDMKTWSLGWTPMHHAVLKGSTSVIDTLIHFGADINIRDHRKRTPLALAKKYHPDNQQLLKLLKNCGARG